LDIVPVFDTHQRRHDDGRRHHASGSTGCQEKQWDGARGNHGSQRDKIPDIDGDYEKGQAHKTETWCNGEICPEGGGYPFASAKSEKGGELVPQKGGKPHNGWSKGGFRKETGQKEDRNKTLEGIQTQGQKPPLDAQGPGHIAGTDISAPMPGDIHAGNEPSNDFAEGDGPQQEGAQGIEEPETLKGRGKVFCHRAGPFIAGSAEAGVTARWMGQERAMVCRNSPFQVTEFPLIFFPYVLGFSHGR